MSVTLSIPEIEGIYQGETFSRKVQLELDNIKQDLSSYGITAELYEDIDDQSTTVADSDGIIEVNDSVILIPATFTSTMLGWYMLKVTFNVGGFITIRKVKFRVEK